MNRLPSKVTDNATPLVLFRQTPYYNFLCTFGCACWPNLRPFNSRKLEFRSKQCEFGGYSNIHKGFKCLDPTTGQIYISRYVVFDEHVFPFSKLHPMLVHNFAPEFCCSQNLLVMGLFVLMHLIWLRRRFLTCQPSVQLLVLCRTLLHMSIVK